MKPTAAATELTRLAAIRWPVMLWGAPGIGKSAIVAKAAADTGRTLIDVRVSQLDPVDLRGLPSVADGRTRWNPPAFLPEPDAAPSLLFLDELSAAAPAMQVACYQLLNERRMGEYVLPDTCAIAAAGNRQSDRAVATRQSTALRSRLIHVTIEPDLDDWCTWALSNGIAPEVIAFVRFRPELLHSFDPTKNDDATFPCPRTWHIASDILQAGPDKATEYELYTGTIGEGAAAEFTGFLRIYRELPHPDAVMMNPTGADVPSDPATLYALCGALAHRAAPNTADRLFQYADRLPAEFSVLLATMAVKTAPTIQATAGFITWAATHSDILF